MPRVCHFEIHADDPSRAQGFYGELFGWTFQQWGNMQYWLVSTGDKSQPGIDGGLIQRQAPIEGLGVNGFVNTVDVPDLDQFVSQAVSLGGVNVVPKMPIPTVGWLAYCKDTEGNIFGMMQHDPTAS